MTNQKMTFKKWEKKFKPINNCQMYETYGEELAFVKTQNPLAIWTWIDAGDGSDNCFIINGFHYVNGLGYYVTELPFKEGDVLFIKHPFD